MKRIVLLLAFFAIGLNVLWAQTRDITGAVTSADDGGTMPGVSISVKGTSLGTITDVDGKYTIKVPTSSNTLVFTFVGMTTKEVAIGNQSVINVQLASENISVDEVVVTAMGMKRDRKALGYAVQDVKAEDLARTGNSNISTALQGKLSGVEIKPSSGMPGASTQIIVRGVRSFTGDNTPLYVVDGMPIASTASYGTGNSVTGTDYANRALDIDPNDIESINILKGQAASALYGIRASNGVVIITTKSGRGLKAGKPVISASSFYSADVISKIPTLQSTWAQGSSTATGYTFGPSSSGAWGPKIVDLPKDPGYGGETSNTYTKSGAELHPGMYYVPQRALGGLDPWVKPQVYDNMGDYFEVGSTLNNSFNISQSTGDMNYSFGVSNVAQKGIVPSTSLDKTTLKLQAETKLGKAWKTGFNGNFTNSYIKKAPTANDGVLATVYAAPVNYDLKGIPYASPTDPYTQILYRATNFNNPYWGVKNNLFDERTNRFYGNGFMEFSPDIAGSHNEKLIIKYQAGVDAYTSNLQDVHEYRSKNTLGSVSQYGISTEVYNSLLTANFDMNILDDLTLNILAGNEINHTNNKSYSETGTNFNFGGWPHINNATTKDASESKSENRTVGFFGNATLAYKNFIYLGGTGRYDVVSSMPRGNRAFFYPSVNLGIVLSELEAVKELPVLSFAKLRGSYAEVGQAGRYMDNYYVLPSYSGGFWTGNPIVYPIGSGTSNVTAYTPNTTQYDPNLKPQNTISYEIGTELKFFNNRFGIDYTFSRQDVKDQIFPVPLAGSTGASSLIMNGGKVHTNTHELVLFFNPIHTKDFDWTVNVNFTKMDNYVDELAPGVESIFLGGFVTPQVRAGIGDKYPVIYGTSFKRDGNGNVLVDERATLPSGAKNSNYGFPLTGAPGVIGTASPDFLLGGSTKITWKKLTASATFDWKNGGQMYSGTSGLLKYAYGLDKDTEDRTSKFIYPGFKADGTPSNIERGGEGDLNALYQLRANVLGNIDEAYIFESSFVKMRELALSYKFVKVYKTLNVNVTAFARNILLWTNYPNFDPEASQGNNNMGGSFERFSVPQTKSFGLGLNIEF